MCLCSSSLTGCFDYVRGISHIRRDSPLPNNACIASAVKSISGVTDYEYKLELGVRPLTLHGIEKPNEVHRHTYRYSGLNGNFYFEVNYKGEVEYHHTYLYLDQIPPQTEINAIRPVMLKIEEGIEENCALPGFASGVTETCMGVKCE